MKKILSKNSVLHTYVALLRGINVGGNRIIKMADLQATFLKMDFMSVRTYIQSGNVIFQTINNDPRKLEVEIEKVLAKKFDYPAKVVVRTLEQMRRLVKEIPQNWHSDTTKKYNVIFLRDAIDSEKILDGLHPKTDIEEVVYHPGVLYWSALASDLARTSMVKLLTQKIYKDMTIRNLNTTKKIYAIMKELYDNSRNSQTYPN